LANSKLQDRHRLRFLPALGLALAVLTPLACRKHDGEQAKPERPSPAELERKATAARQALNGLKPLLDAQHARFSALHREFDPLPPGLPGFGDTRGAFYAADEGLGMLSSALPWLSGRIDAAVKAGDLAQLKELSSEIDDKYAQVREVERLGTELSERVQPFKREALIKLEALQALGKTTCE
jgi:hypothetical protein